MRRCRPAHNVQRWGALPGPSLRNATLASDPLAILLQVIASAEHASAAAVPPSLPGGRAGYAAPCPHLQRKECLQSSLFHRL